MKTLRLLKIRGDKGGVLPLVALATFTFTGLQSSNAQIITNTDTAANYGGAGEPSWTNGANAGSGFGSWNLFITTDIGGSAGTFLGSSASQGFGNIDTSGQSFGMYGNPAGNNYANAERGFSSSLNVGDSFSIDLAVAFRNGNKGISLFSGGFAPANEVWNFNVAGDQYTAGGSNLGWAYSQTSVFNLLATQTAADSYTISLTRGVDTYSTNIVGLGGLSGFRLYVGSTEAGNDLNNLFFNNMQTTIVPEPSTYAMLGLSALALLGYGIRRRIRNN
jgi:hypothetical protein